MGLDEELKICSKSGKMILGCKAVIRDLGSRNIRSKLIILANNCPEQYRLRIEKFAKLTNTPVLKYDAGALELGKAVGKKFLVSALAVIDEGDSSILKYAEGETSEGESSGNT